MRPTILTSVAQTWAASRTFPFDLSFLNPMRDAVAPVIDEFLLILNITSGATGTAGCRGGAFASAFSNVLVKDQSSERINVRGSSLRVINQQLYGSGFQDPAMVAASASAQTRKLILRIPFTLPKARRPRDFSMPLRGFLDGGKLQVTTSAALLPGMGANGFTITTATIQLVAIVRDEGVREAKSTAIFCDEAISLPAYDYSFAGAAFMALAYNGEINESAATAWSAQTVSSRTLDMQQIDDYMLQDLYAIDARPPRSSPGVVGTADTYAQTDTVLTGQTVPVIWQAQDQKIPEMPQFQTLHYKTSLSSITTSDLPQMIKGYIVPRDASVTSRVLGVANPVDAIEKRGSIKAANGNARAVNAFPPNIARMMPVKVGKRS